MRMDEIDKEIAAIEEVDKGTPNKQKPEGTAAGSPPRKNFYDTPEEATAEVEDIVVEEDDDGEDDDDIDEDADAGLEDLQKEMKELEAQQVVPQQEPATQKEQAPKEFVRETISATCVKPTQSSAVGISMKTSKGITRIVAINPKGLLAKSRLRPGLQLIQVNGVNVKNARYAKSIIDSHHGTITLVAQSMPPE